ncbi:hypothetical protein [Roseibium aestuarii]|uniref:Protein NnrT n=1 Tax=Roseibium aestuarii TaxID=2600299 RepID=A0ABW4JZC1_9HYPH|nr:hypothetical protein [Roseibium aestuarii]
MKAVPLGAAVLALTALLPTRAALAAAFSRPVPNAQTGTAEMWFLAASLGLVLALLAVHWLVARR